MYENLITNYKKKRVKEIAVNYHFQNDYGYSVQYPDLDFTPAAAILTRVISHPAPHYFTVDTGYKAVASEQTIRGVIVETPDALPIAQSEEHWVWKLENSEIPPIGTVLYIIPAHICPTSALYAGVSWSGAANL
jgi:D-serine deaminase-like pyridoxal phosphate-dependent protein